jgi:hypothetical protein
MDGCKFHSIKEWEKIFAMGTYKVLCKDYDKCRQAFKKAKKIAESL